MLCRFVLGVCKCNPVDFQMAGRLALVGFVGNASNFTCYLNTTCYLGPVRGFGLQFGDTVGFAAGSECGTSGSILSQSGASVAGIGSAQPAAAWLSRDRGLAPDVDGDVPAAVCYCPVAPNGRLGCAKGSSTMFPLLLGLLRYLGLRNRYVVGCTPASEECPEVPLMPSESDVTAASHGRILFVEHHGPGPVHVTFEEAPCRLWGHESVVEAELTPWLRVPWPLVPGRYAICFCFEAVGCLGASGSQVPPMQHIGDLRIFGAVRNVTLLQGFFGPGIATIPLEVAIREETPGFRCCAVASGTRIDWGAAACGEFHASSLGRLRWAEGGVYAFGLVIPEMRIVASPGNTTATTRLDDWSVACRGLAEVGRCAGSAAP